MLFSATMPAAIVSLARTHMRHPMNIRAESSYENATVPLTAQFIYQCPRPRQARDHRPAAAVRGRRQVHRLHPHQARRAAGGRRPRRARLQRRRPARRHAQVAREKTLTRFREDKLQVLVATDVAARGIDVAGVSHVINYSCPEDDKTYVHRIGRTGRAGAIGHRDHLRRLGRPAPLEDDQQDARPAVRRAAGDLLHLASTSSTTRASRPAPGAGSDAEPVERKPPRPATAATAAAAVRPGDRATGPRRATATAAAPAAAQTVAQGARLGRHRRRRRPPARARRSAPAAPSAGNRNRRRRRRGGSGGGGAVRLDAHRVTP